jgi:hypothetical protein
VLVGTIAASLSVMRIVLPIGVSLYTFQAHRTYGHYIITQRASGGHWPGRRALIGVSGF